ncbi:hypothetical protein PM8797T_11304 [Gimesia maris DSM 8797]|nr:hypothetical protein PM8797T_11304 [Gimesia maris DSM 8797]
MNLSGTRAVTLLQGPESSRTGQEGSLNDENP